MSKENVIVFDLSTEGLEPLKHRIIGITIKTAKEEKIITYRDEKQILQEFWDYIERGNYNKVIGFNSSSFDVPMLLLRSVKHNVRIAKSFIKKHIDLRKILFKYTKQEKGTLNDFQEMLNIEFYESRYQEMHMSYLWEADFEFKKLREFLLRDTMVTWTLYEHLKEAFI